MGIVFSYLLSHVWLLQLHGLAHQALLGFPRQEYWSGLPFPSPGDLPDPGIKPTSPALAGRFFITESPGKPHKSCSTLVFTIEKNPHVSGPLQVQTYVVQWSAISVQFSCSDVSDFVTPWTAAHQASQSITNSQSLLKLMSIKSVMLSNHLILCRPLLLLPSIFPSIRVFSNQSVLHIRWPKIGISASASVLPISLDGLVGSPCSSRDSQKSAPTPQFKSINSSALSFLYSPTLTSIHDHWKNHSLD